MQCVCSGLTSFGFYSYKRQSRQLIQVRAPPSTHPDIYDVANPVLYAEPIYGPV